MYQSERRPGLWANILSGNSRSLGWESYRIAALRQNHSQPHMLGEKFGAAREFIELAKKTGTVHAGSALALHARPPVAYRGIKPELGGDSYRDAAGVLYPETSIPTKQVIDGPPMVRITGQSRPDRGTIDKSMAGRERGNAARR
jgi:hypothetical protein